MAVVEARDRLGGRVDTRLDPVLGVAVERGAEFVHGRPQLTLALARRSGARVREIPDRHAQRTGPRLSESADSFESAQELLGLGTRDDEPFAAVLRRVRSERRFPPAAVDMAGDFVRGFYLADPRTASSLALARMTRALDEIDGDVTSRVEGGYARVLEPLVRAIRRSGAELRLSSAVEEIRWARGRVEVRARSATGARLDPISADRAIVTLPLPMIAQDLVRFRPRLDEKRRAAASLAMGPIVKVVLRFRRAPWGDSGRRDLAFLHVPGATVPVFWTLAPIDAPVLVGWAGVPGAERLAGKQRHEVIRAALRSAAQGLGCAARELDELLDAADVADWTSDPFARGGYAVFPAGSAGASDALASSVEETLFFAGEATAGVHAGTVDGALRSGERAARELVASL